MDNYLPLMTDPDRKTNPSLILTLILKKHVEFVYIIFTLEGIKSSDVVITNDALTF